MPQRKKIQQDFEQMLRRSRSILYGVCLAFTDRQPENVKDLYQEIVCNLWHGWPKCRSQSNPTTWVYRVAINTAFMGRRKHSIGTSDTLLSLGQELCDTLVEEAADPQLERLYQLIDQLSDIDKRLIYLHLDHLTNSQIAAITGKSENAVKQQIYRIRNRLIQLNQQMNED